MNGKEFTAVGCVARMSFILFEQPFTKLIGSENSYWVGLMGFSTANMNKAFSDIAGSGATVVRTWYGQNVNKYKTIGIFIVMS